MKVSVLLRKKSLRATLLVLAQFTFGHASAQSSDGEIAYWCEHSNGSVFAQREPCEPGKEVRRGRFVPGGNGLIESEPVAGVVAETDIPNRKPIAETPLNTAPATSLAVTAEKTDKDVLREGQISLLKLLGFALAFGLIAKVLGRSFWGGFVGGAVLRIVLVSLNLMKF
jgi:hypothetical protein